MKGLKLPQVLCTAHKAAAIRNPAQKPRRGEDTQDPSGSPKGNKQPPYYFFRFCIRQKEKIKKKALEKNHLEAKANPGQQLAYNPATP